MKKSLLMAMSRTAWAMTDRAMKVGIAVLSRDEWFAELRREALNAREGKPLQQAKRVAVYDGVAVVPVVGPIFRRADAFEEMCGGESATYDALRKDFQKTLEDESIHTILLDVDSPGGEVNGCDEMAEAIYQARGAKRIVAYVGGMGASAAYWIASAAHEIVAAPTAELGSIGVRSGYLDDSRALEKAGFKEWVFVASQSPKKAFDPNIEDDRDRLQLVLDDLADVFISRVARNRGVTADKVIKSFGQGDVMVGDRAVTAGLADRLGDFESTLAQLIANKGAAMTMATKPNDGIRASDSDNEWKCTGCKEMMGPSATKYCAKCAAPDDDGDDDDDSDEDEAKALGLPDPKASRGARLARMAALVHLETKVLGITKAEKHDAALALVESGMTAHAELAKVRTEAQRTQLRSMLERGLAGAPGEQPKLSLGIIQKTLATTLRGEAKKAWNAAMQKVAADADQAQSTVTAAQILDAASSVALSTDDVESIADYIANAPVVAASTHAEPHRDGEKEAAELDETARIVAEEWAKARAALDGNTVQPAAK